MIDVDVDVDDSVVWWCVMWCGGGWCVDVVWMWYGVVWCFVRVVVPVFFWVGLQVHAPCSAEVLPFVCRPRGVVFSLSWAAVRMKPSRFDARIVNP